jgi:hypothetical protein
MEHSSQTKQVFDIHFQFGVNVLETYYHKPYLQEKLQTELHFSMWEHAMCKWQVSEVV